MEPEEKIQLTRSTYEELKKLAQDNLAIRAGFANAGLNYNGPTDIIRLLDSLKYYKVNFELLTHCVLGLTGVFGLNVPDGTAIRPEILLPETDENRENVMPAVMKALGGLMQDIMFAEAPGEIGRKKKEQLAQKFDFFKYLEPISSFYQGQKALKLKMPADILAALPEKVKTQLV